MGTGFDCGSNSICDISLSGENSVRRRTDCGRDRSWTWRKKFRNRLSADTGKGIYNAGGVVYETGTGKI